MSSLVPRPTMAFTAGESGFHIADNKNFLRLENEATLSPPTNYLKILSIWDKKLSAPLCSRLAYLMTWRHWILLISLSPNHEAYAYICQCSVCKILASTWLYIRTICKLICSCHVIQSEVKSSNSFSNRMGRVNVVWEWGYPLSCVEICLTDTRQNRSFMDNASNGLCLK